MPDIKRWTLSLLLCSITCALQQDEIAEHQELSRRNLDAVDKLRWQQPQGIRKMSNDPGEKFWAHYWDFDTLSGNLSSPSNPARLHDTSASLLGRLIFARDASCPTNYSPCTSIGHSDSCCPDGQTCITVQDTGNGPVGCCAAGATCGNTISGCADGYTSCPDSSNKGCCIPGYVCAGNICVNANTQTVTASTSTSTTTTTPLVVSVTTLTVTNVNTSGYTTTATVTVTQSVSGTAIAPVRPTTDSSTVIVIPASVSTITTTTSTSTTTSISTSTSTSTTSTASGYCPTGFYMCSAVYLGGCCQVDRDCNTTSCPPTASTTVIDGSPTVVAPTGATSNALLTCATGWYACPASLGGNCCPSGYSCGQTNCPATVAGVAAQNKQTPSEATTLTLAWMYILIASSTALGMILL